MLLAPWGQWRRKKPFNCVLCRMSRPGSNGLVEVEVEVEVSRGLYRVGRRRRAIAPSFYRECPPLIGLRAALPCSPPRPSGAHP